VCGRCFALKRAVDFGATVVQNGNCSPRLIHLGKVNLRGKNAFTAASLKYNISPRVNNAGMSAIASYFSCVWILVFTDTVHRDNVHAIFNGSGAEQGTEVF